MDATRQRHFTLLQGLEHKYKQFGSASETEKSLLVRLLRDHDEQVAHFRTAITTLRSQDPQAHAILVDYIAALNDTLAPFAASHTRSTEPC